MQVRDIESLGWHLGSSGPRLQATISWTQIGVGPVSCAAERKNAGNVPVRDTCSLFGRKSISATTMPTTVANFILRRTWLRTCH